MFHSPPPNPTSRRPPRAHRGPGRPRRADDEQGVRERLIEAATGLFGQRGFGEVGIREVAAAAGVTPGMIAYYFDGKQGLYQAMLDSVFDRLLEQLREIAAAPPAGSEPLDAFFDLYIRTLARDPWVPKLIVREVLSSDTPLRAHFIERFVSRAAKLIPLILEQQTAEGRLRSDLDPGLTLLSMVGAAVFPFLSYPLVGPVLGFELDDDFRDRLIAHTARLFREGARPAGAEG